MDVERCRASVLLKRPVLLCSSLLGGRSRENPRDTLRHEETGGAGQKLGEGEKPTLPAPHFCSDELPPPALLRDFILFYLPDFLFWGGTPFLRTIFNSALLTNSERIPQDPREEPMPAVTSGYGVGECASPG